MVSFSQTSFSYTGKEPEPTRKNNVEGYSVQMKMPSLNTEVGKYKVTIPTTFTKGEESFTANIPYNYTIEPVKLKAKVNSTSRSYGDDNPTFSITYSGFVNGENEKVLTSLPVVTTTVKKTSSVGIYPITISGGSAKNYTLEYEQGELTISKAPLTIQVTNVNRVYGEDNPSFTLSYLGLKNNESLPKWTSSPVFTTNANKNSNVGSYAITVDCDPKNYLITSRWNGTLTITRAPLTIVANNASMQYGGTMPTYTFTYSGFVNGDSEDAITTKPSIVTEATVTSDVGNYTITPRGAEAINYDFTYKAGTLTINQRPLLAKVNSTSRFYGDMNPIFTIDYKGFVNGDDESSLTTKPVVETSANEKSIVGDYPLYAYGGESKNYIVEYGQGVLTVEKAPLAIKVNDASKNYG